MHSITLDAAASALLLSGILCLGLLLKRTPSSRLGSNASVLSISDMSSSLLTALVLLLHRFYLEPDSSLSDNNNDVRLMVTKQRSTPLHHEPSNASFTAPAEECEFQAVFFQYAVFLVPFANAFVSLLSFSTSCYAGTSRIERRCRRLYLEASSGRRGNETSVTLMEQPKKRTFPVGKRLYGTGLAVLSQWLLPALFTGVFQLADHRRIELATNRTMHDDLACTVAANFPFENCAEELFSAPETLSVSSSSILQNYVSSEDNLLWPSPNSSETHELVSRIYAIVQSALNDSLSVNTSSIRPAQSQQQHYNITQLLDASTLLNDSDTTGRARSKTRAVDSYAHIRFFDDEDGTQQVVRCAKNRCVVSRRFLQVHLFLFLSLVYFVPILASALLLVASYYKCREIAQKLSDCRAGNQSDDAKPPQDPSPSSPGSEVQKEDGACARFAEEACQLSCETERIQSFYQVFKVNVLLAVALWTPFFLQLISKSFFCSNVPGWLMEVAFLATIVFGVFRNAINLTVAKIDAEQAAEESKKHNSVHPN